MVCTAAKRFWGLLGWRALDPLSFLIPLDERLQRITNVTVGKHDHSGAKKIGRCVCVRGGGCLKPC